MTPFVYFFKRRGKYRLKPYCSHVLHVPISAWKPSYSLYLVILEVNVSMTCQSIYSPNAYSFHRGYLNPPPSTRHGASMCSRFHCVGLTVCRVYPYGKGGSLCPHVWTASPRRRQLWIQTRSCSCISAGMATLNKLVYLSTFLPRQIIEIERFPACNILDQTRSER